MNICFVFVFQNEEIKPKKEEHKPSSLNVGGGVALAVDDNLLCFVKVAHISLNVNTASVVPGARPEAAPASDHNVVEGATLNL